MQRKVEKQQQPFEKCSPTTHTKVGNAKTFTPLVSVVVVVVYCSAPTTKLVGEGDGEGDQVLI